MPTRVLWASPQAQSVARQTAEASVANTLHVSVGRHVNVIEIHAVRVRAEIRTLAVPGRRPVGPSPSAGGGVQSASR